VNVTWNDNDICRAPASRQMRWTFSVNGHFVLATPYGLPNDALAIGTNSTYRLLNATNAEITAFLDAEGVTIENGDIIEFAVNVRNCQGETSRSNFFRILAELPDILCDCSIETAAATGQSGNTATAPGAFTADYLVLRNGFANYEILDFTGEPLVTDDQLLFVQLSGCAANLRQQIVTGATGNVPSPTGIPGLAATHFLLFRNGQLQRGYTVSGSNIVPGIASEADDRWLFVDVQGSTAACTFGVRLIGASYTGATFTLPAGYNAGNQDKWLPVVNGIVLSPGGVGYSVSGSTVTLTTAAAGDEIWIIIIE